MEKYEKLFKGLEMCAGPDCNPECPYHGETRGGKTCRAWLLNDAAAALATEESRAEASEHDAKLAHSSICGLRERVRQLERQNKTVEHAAKDIAEMNYWRGQAEALKEFLRFYCGGAVEGVRIDLPDMHGEPEPEAGGHD